MTKILVVEDEFPIADLINIALTNVGYHVDYALDGKTGADLMEKCTYDCALLDIMLPEFDGYELLEYAKVLDIPVIFITAKGTVKDRIKGLDMGADDYIIKPFEIDELIARVNSVMRRCKPKMSIKNIEIDEDKRVVKKDGQDVKLTPKEFELFLLLYKNQEKVQKREKIFEQIWGDELEFETRTLDLHIQRIRKKLDLKEEIKTIHKIGYIFEEKK